MLSLRNQVIPVSSGMSKFQQYIFLLSFLSISIQGPVPRLLYFFHAQLNYDISTAKMLKTMLFLALKLLDVVFRSRINFMLSSVDYI